MPKVELIGNLSFGEGLIGKGVNFEDQEARLAFQADLASCIKPITRPNTADCPDGRKTVALADGTTDPHELEERVAHQLLGGLVLSTTKAAVAADLAVIRDAKTFQTAYETMYGLLNTLGYEDGGHEGCGASKLVEASVAAQLPQDSVLAAMPAFRAQPDDAGSMLAANWQRKQRLVENGFYGDWSPAWHENFLAEKAPQNFSTLEVDPDSPTGGHHEEALFLIKQPGMGFAKNRFIAITGGREVFAETAHTPEVLVKDIVKKIGGSELERARFLLEFDSDAPQIVNKLAAQGLSVFADAA